MGKRGLVGARLYDAVRGRFLNGVFSAKNGESPRSDYVDAVYQCTGSR